MGRVDNIFILLYVIFLNKILEISSVTSPDWTTSDDFCYDPEDKTCGPSSWPETCRIGGMQSPINIDPLPSQIAHAQATTFNFNSHYGNVHHGIFSMNTGHSLQIQLQDTMSASSFLRFSGAGLSDSYTFAQLHFHWGRTTQEGSEHTIRGKRFPLELHLVHYNDKYLSLEDAMNNEEDPNAVAVLAVFFEISNDENISLQPIVNLAIDSTSAEKKDKFSKLPTMTLNVMDLLPQDLDFVRYHGSLTTPPCTENVVWTIFTHGVPIQVSQLTAFQNLENKDMDLYFNYRPLQPPNGRSLTYYKVPQNRKVRRHTLSNAIEIPGVLKLVQEVATLLRLLLVYLFKIELMHIPNHSFIPVI